ncbi:MAG: sorbosone dehydrogenase family protein [Candidatus Nitrosocosmicus sp.]
MGASSTNNKMLLLFLPFICLNVLFIFPLYFSVPLAIGAYSKASPHSDGPVLADNGLAVEMVVDELDFPTSMAFLGENDILVTEKNTGKVIRIVNGEIIDEPVIDVAVATQIERGLLGIDVSKDPYSGKIYAFLYYTESGNGEDASDIENGVDPLGNRLYRYELVEDKMINPLLLLDLPADPIKEGRTDHNGGKVVVGPDNNVYLIVGEVGGHRTQAQNIAEGPDPNGLGGILRITQDGKIVESDTLIFGESSPLNLYYAIGIRNSFGMDFDPVTGNLWDTENGASYGDEINLVTAGFNSGWSQIQGYGEDYDDNDKNGNSLNAEKLYPKNLIYFGNSHYSDPEFVWVNTIGITDITFLDSDKLGKHYTNNMFVGDINNGNVYRFVLNDLRNGIFIENFDGRSQPLSDKEIDEPNESQPLVFGQGFGGITDIEDGMDGYLYVLTFSGSLYKILPSS